LLMLDKNQEAEAALAEGRTVAAYSQSPAVHLIFAIADARSQAAGAAGLRSLARMQLIRSANEAAKLGFMPLQYEAQLALGELEISENAASARNGLESLEKRAREHGLELIARKAAALRQRHAGSGSFSSKNYPLPVSASSDSLASRGPLGRRSSRQR
jgi:hypothetical protein